MPDDDQPKIIEPTVAPVEQVRPAPQQPVAPTNGLAIASFVVGIVAFISGWIPFWGLLVGVAAVLLGMIALKKPEGKGLSITGIVTGGLGALAGLTATAFVILAIVSSGAINESRYSQMQEETPGAQEMIDAKKDFAKGEVGAFGPLDVTVNSVTRNYTPTGSVEPLNDRSEYIVVNITVENMGEDSEYVSHNDFLINEGGLTSNRERIDSSPEFKNGSLSPGETVNGNLVYRVVKDATDLKIQYSLDIITPNSRSDTLVYTLAI